MVPLLKEILVEVLLLVGAGAITFVPLWLFARTPPSRGSRARDIFLVGRRPC